MKQSAMVPVLLPSQLFTFAPDGTVTVDRIPSDTDLESARLAAADIYLNEKWPELSRPEREFWKGVRRPSEWLKQPVYQRRSR